MIDSEIIKALEYCSDGWNCENCAFDDEDESMSECTSKLTEAALDLIQRQKTEIKILKQKRVNMFEILEAVERGRAKGIKELRDKIVEQLEEMEKVHQKSLDKYYDNSSGYSCVYDIGDIKENIIATIKKAIDVVKGAQNE